MIITSKSGDAVAVMIKIVRRLIIIIALAMSSRAFAVEPSSDIPAWLRAHIGEGEGQNAN